MAMASFPTTFKCQIPNSFPILTPITKLRFPYPTVTVPTPISSINLLDNSNPTQSIRANSTPNAAFEQNLNETVNNQFRKWTEVARAVFPGGSWWNLSDFEGKFDDSSVTAKPKTVLYALSQMWALVAEERVILCVAFVALTIAALSEITMPAIITTCIFSAQNGATNAFYQNLKLLFLLCIISGICSGLRGGCFAIANVILVKRLRKTVYSSVLLQDISFFDRETVGDLTSRIGTGCQRLSHTIGNDVHLILRNVIQGSGAFINLMILSWPLALSSLAICLVLTLIFRTYGLYQKHVAKLDQEFAASANEVAQETLTLIRTVRAYGTEKEELQRFTQWIDRLTFVGLRESVAYGLWNLSFMTLYRMTQVFAVVLGGTSIMSGCVSVEQLTKYVLYCEWLIYAAWRVQDNLTSLLQSVGACEKVFQLMTITPSGEFLSRGKKLQELTGSVDFVDVSFHFSSRNMVLALKNVSFSVQANEIIAVVGVSGSGKSTLINLLLRLYEPSSGEIFIDGIPLTEINIRWLREKVGFVGQEPHLFHMDVKSNLCYGCSRDMVPEKIEHAAKIANAHEFISALPSGYDTIINDNLLSGGQKQRIAIARAILRNPRILVLDEATSALDAENEGYIKEILQSVKNDPETRKTIILIAHSFEGLDLQIRNGNFHRLSTIEAADRILVMNNGEIVEIGDHNELLERNGHYARLFKLQTDAISATTIHHT